MRTEYIFKIDEVYELTTEDSNEIKSDTDDKKKWKDGYKNFKSNIRKHLKLEQNGRCAFCRNFVNLGSGYSNLEHLISKTDYSQFEFLPCNLVYSCWICNKSKLKKNTIKNPIAKKEDQEFPTDKEEFLIINPYFDNFEEHIDFIEEVVIISKKDSEKGKNTISYYNLSRPELAEDRAREFRLDQKNINEKLLFRLTTNSDDEEILNQINAILGDLPNWTL